MARAVAAIFALAVLAMLAVGGFQVALENAGEDHTVTNETWTPSPGSVTQLDNSERTGAYYDNETTVYNTTGSTAEEMDEGTDYVWFEGNGTVKAVSGGGLDGATEATISYSFQQTTEEQRQWARALSNIPSAIGLAFPVMLFILFLVILRGG